MRTIERILYRLHKIPGHPSLAKQKHIANEILLFFVPLVKNLRLISIVKELEKLSLEVLGK